MSRRGHRLTDQDREHIVAVVERMRANNDGLLELTHNRPELKALMERPKDGRLH